MKTSIEVDQEVAARAVEILGATPFTTPSTRRGEIVNLRRRREVVVLLGKGRRFDGEVIERGMVD